MNSISITFADYCRLLQEWRLQADGRPGLTAYDHFDDWLRTQYGVGDVGVDNIARVKDQGEVMGRCFRIHDAGRAAFFKLKYT